MDLKSAKPITDPQEYETAGDRESEVERTEWQKDPVEAARDILTNKESCSAQDQVQQEPACSSVQPYVEERANQQGDNQTKDERRQCHISPEYLLLN
jgi:hypothetical protein